MPGFACAGCGVAADVLRKNANASPINTTAASRPSNQALPPGNFVFIVISPALSAYSLPT
jgi:hypothetical protein